jgi:AAA family ATP:ADP antiporter
MINPVGGVFSMRREEVGLASLLFSYLFLVIGAYLMGQAVGDALFLAAFPRHLPIAMIGSALVVGALVAVYIRLSARLRLQSLIIGTLLFFALSFVSFWWLAQLHLHWVYWLVYIWVYAAGAMGPMMGWTLANYLLTAREARRIFGFIGAGAILGGTLVSFVTSDVLRRGNLKPQSLLLGVALILAICALLVGLLFRSSGQRLAALSGAPITGQQTPRGFGQSLKLIHNSHYLVLLTGLIAVGCLATCILGYQFKLIAKTAYGTNTAALAAFFSRFNGYMGLASLVFQLVLTGPLLRTFGIRVTLFVVPITLMCGSLGVILAPTLLSGSILRGSHYLLRYSLDKSSTELLYLPVSPEVKSQVKSFIDTFVWRSADGIAGLTLLFFANVLKFSPSEVSFVNLFVLAGWLAIAYGVRREYLNVLRQAIERRTLDPIQTAAQVLDSSTTEVLGQALERGSEQQLLYGMSLFEMGRHTGWHPALRQLLEHRSPAVRQSALRLLGDAGDRAILPRVEKLLGDESLEMRAEALHYLVVHAGRDPLTLLSGKSDVPAYVLQGAIVAYLARNAESDSSSATGLILQSMLTQAGTDAVPARREAARVLGVIPPPSALHDRLQELLRDEYPEVVEQALLSAGKIRGREFLPAVIAKLGQQRAAAAARTALILYGESAIGALGSNLNDPAVPLPVRKQIAQTLARIPGAGSVEVLAHSLVQSDPGLRYDVLKALNQLRDRDPALLPSDVDYADLLNAELIGYLRSFQILAAYDSSPGKSPGAESSHSSGRLVKRAFQEHMDHELERIFRLLSLLYPPRDIHNAYVGLISGRPQLQANALEVLEHLLQPELYRRLANVLDPEVDPRRRLDFARQVCCADVSSRIEALRILLHSEDNWVRSCALYAVGGLELKELLPDINRVPYNRDALLAETWNWAVARLAPGATA